MTDDSETDEIDDDEMDVITDPLLNMEYLAAAALWEQIQLHREKAGLEPDDKTKLPPQIDPAFYRSWEYL
jgi:hypothetical protein